MKAKIAAAVVAVFAAFGLGTGIANAADAVVTEPVADGVVTSASQNIDAALHSIDLIKDTQPAEKSPLKDVMKFLEEGINLAGRDVVVSTAYAEDIPTGDTSSDVDNPTAPFKLPTYDDPGEKNIVTEPEFSLLTTLGTAVDRVVAALPGVNKIRETGAWNSDYFRVFGALAVVTTLLLPVTLPLGVVGGSGVSAVLGTLVVAGAVLVGALSGVPVGIIPGVIFGLIGGILLPIVLLATPLWLVAGIILVVLGAAGTPATMALSAILIPIGSVFIVFGLLPVLPIGIALGFLLLGFVCFWGPITIGAAVLLPVGLVLGLATFFLTMLITVPVGAGIALGVPLLLAFLAVALWLNNDPTRRKGKSVRADTGATTALMSTRDDVQPASSKNVINKIGDLADWFWDDLQWLMGKIPFVGPSLQRGINGLRHSKLWKSDPFRVATVISALTTISAPIAGILIASGAVAAGIAAFAIAAVLLALPLAGIGVLLTGLLIVVMALVPAALVGGGIFAMILGVLVMMGGSAGILTGLVNPIIEAVGGAATFIGLLIFLGGLLVFMLGFFPVIWLPFLGLALLVGGLVTGVLFVLGLILALPAAFAIGVAVFGLIAIVAIIVPTIIMVSGLATLALGLIFGLALPTRPAGEPQPKITRENDPEYQHKDNWRYGRTNKKQWEDPHAENKTSATDTTPLKEGTRADYGLAA